jgi:beta-galactosidase
MLKFFISILVPVCLLANSISAQVRASIDFDKDWKFFLGNDSLASSPGYDDRSWRKLSLPHDWSIEASFSQTHPATNQGGALPGGIGWYRKSFTLPAQYSNKKIAIEFDGVYKNSQVWINGHYLGIRPNGYISFAYDLDPYLKPYPAKNIIAVKVDNSPQPDSRWYSGSGIYRHVRVVVRNNISFAPWGIFITTPEIREKSARVFIQTQLENFNTGTATVSLRTESLMQKENWLVPAIRPE